MSESQLVNACLDLLRLKNIFCWRNNTGAIKTGKGGFIRFGAPGSPDILAILPPHGMLLGIECKLPGCRQLASQLEFEAKMHGLGAEYWLIKTVDELVEKLAGIDKKNKVVYSK